MTSSKSQSSHKHSLILMPSGRRGQVPDGLSLLQAADQLGVRIESICGGKGTCGKCRVLIEEGDFSKHGIFSSQDHLTPRTAEENKILAGSKDTNLRLACAGKIQGNLLVTIPEESQAQKQIIRKSASEKVIQVDPAIRRYYLEVDQAQLGEHQGDWGRLQNALSSQWNLPDLSIDLYALQHLQSSLEMGNWRVTATIWKDQTIIDLQPGYQEGVYGLAVDIGSTTVAAYLCDLRSGELLASAGKMNPQVSFGEDLMSRISFSTTQPDGLKVLNQAICKTINSLAVETSHQAGIRARDIQDTTLVGNTTMIHILLGISPEPLGGAPFALALREPLDLKSIELGLKLHPNARAHLLPAEAGHVGSDNVAVLIAEQPYMESKTILIVDVGTNAEIVLSTGNQIFSASSPTGPAFEGGQISSGMRAAPGAIERVRIDQETKSPRFRVIGEDTWSDTWQIAEETPLENQPGHLASGICGSGIIEAVAELFTAGLITAEGRFNPEVESSYMLWDPDRRKGSFVLADSQQSSSGKPILITQEDVRNVQLAKAALYAGAKLLMSHAGVTKLDKVILAGAFGSFINPTHALTLGLFPDCSPENIFPVGNAAGDGARFALLNHPLRKEANSIAQKVRYIETAVDPDFQRQFVAAMHLPHNSDSFPHLEHILQKVPAALPRSRKRRYPRKKT